MTEKETPTKQKSKITAIRESNWLPNLSLGGSLLGGLLFLMPYLGLPLAIGSIVAGFMSKKDTSKNTAGIILGFLQIPLHLIMLLLVGVIFASGAA